MDISFDTRAIVKNFGGAAAIMRLYEKHDLQISRSAINNWVKRKAIHGKQIATLIRLAQKERLRFNLEDFVVDGEDDAVDYGQNAYSQNINTVN